MKTVWLVLLVACGNKSDHADHGGDWPSRPTATVNGAVPVNHEPGPAYAIDVPKGLVPDVSDSGYSATGAVFYWAGSEVQHDLDAPNVMVTVVDAPNTVEDAIKSVYSDFTMKVMRKDAIDHGFVVTWRGVDGKHNGWTVHVFKTVGAKALMCRAAQNSDAAELGEATRTMLEKICLSLRSS